MHPLHLQLDEVHLGLGYELSATGTGTLDLLTPWGPRLAFDGDMDGGHDGFDFIKRSSGGERQAGKLFHVPERVFRAGADGLEVHGAWRQSISPKYHASGRVVGQYAPHRVVVSPVDAPKPTDGRFAFVHYLGKNPSLWPGVRFEQGFKPNEKYAVHDGDHVFYLGGLDPKVKEHADWSQVGGFCYAGPVLDDAKELAALFNKFTLVLGAALLSPIDVVGFVVVDGDGLWERTVWQQGPKSYNGRGANRPIGADYLEGGGQHLVDWVNAVLRCWRINEPKLGLDLTLRYIEQAPSRPEVEMRCLDVVVAIERLATCYLQCAGKLPAKQIGIQEKVSRMQTELGSRVLTKHERDVIRRIRNQLGHLGDLMEQRYFNRDEVQTLLLTEGWLFTCFNRLLAAVVDVDVPLKDLGCLGHLALRPSEGGFAGPPFVPPKK